MTSEEHRAHDIAVQIATAEILRLVIGEAFFSTDRQEFKNRMRKLEDAAISSLASRRLFATANDATESYIKEAASGWISRLFASILHPGDKPDGAHSAPREV